MSVALSRLVQGSNGGWKPTSANDEVTVFRESTSSNGRLNVAAINFFSENTAKGPGDYWKTTADGFLNFASLANETHLYQMTKSGTQLALSSKFAYQTAKSFGTKIGFAGLILTPLDAAIKDKWQNHHKADTFISSAFIAAGFIPGINLGVAIVGLTYYAVDFAFQVRTGKSITERLD
jgi:hypothetical protein